MLLISSKLKVSEFFLVLFISYLAGSVVAQLTAQECGRRAGNANTGLLESVLAQGGANDDTLWCQYWATVCAYFHQTCPYAVSCTFEYDRQSPGCPSTYDPSDSSFSNFRGCKSCNVVVEPSVAIPPRAHVPTYSGSGTISGYTSTRDNGPVETGYPDDVSAEKRSISDATSAFMLIIFALGLIGSFFALKASSSASSQFPSDTTGHTEVLEGVPVAMLSSSLQSSGNPPSAIDPVTLLLHFQSISTSGFLSLSYPNIYRYFTFNFSWANLIVVSAGIRNAVNQIGLNMSCLRLLNDLSPTNADNSGLAVVAERYGVDRTVLGGIVFLGAIIGLACALGLFVLVASVLNILAKTSKSSTVQSLAQNWPFMASNLSLRLFVWLLGTICTFAFYQFNTLCSSASLIALSATEFSLMIITLLFVSMLIVRAAKREGDPRALFPSESDHSQYSRKWGSLYTTFKPAVYWFFILDYQWVVVRSGIVALGQGYGAVQVSLLVALEFVIFIVLLVKRPYRTRAASALQFFLAGKRLISTVLLLSFLDQFLVKPNIKRNVGIIVLSIESIVAISLFGALLVKGGAAILEWNSKRKERRAPLMKSESIEQDLSTVLNRPNVRPM